MIRVVTKDEISDLMFDQMVALDHAHWNEEDPCHLSKEYLESIFLPSKEGVFLALDGDRVVGYFNCIFVNMDMMHAYLESGDFEKLQNLHLQVGENVCYIFTCFVVDAYRGSGVMKALGEMFGKYLDEKEKEGCHVRLAYAEAVSEDGARCLRDGFLMEAMDDVDEEGLGHYVSRDGLRAYRKKVR